MKHIVTTAVLLAVQHVAANAAACGGAECTISVPADCAPGDACTRPAAGRSALLSASDAVRALLRGATQPVNVTVCLCAGVHLVGEPLHFTAADEAPLGSRVTWRSIEPHAAMVSGGVQLTSWTPTTLGGGAVYAHAIDAPVPSPVRQLWVAGTRASRTVLTNVNSALGGMSFWLSPDKQTGGFKVGTVPSAWINNTNAIEFTWPIVVANWISPRCTLESVDVATGNITLTSPCGALLSQRSEERTKGLPPPPVTAEAVPMFPLAPGTFYHDVAGSTLYYALAPGQTPGDLEASAWVPAQSVLLSYTNSSTPHTWEGVTFTYASSWQVNSPDGFVDAQSAVIMCTAATSTCEGGEAEPRGAVQVLSSANIAFTGCVFESMGTVYALSAEAGSQNISVNTCMFRDLSGGAMKLASINAIYASNPNPAFWDSGYSAVNNTAMNGSLEYFGAAAIFVGYAYKGYFGYNYVDGAGYSGMSVGWGWGTVFPAGTGGHVVEFNRFVNVMKTLRDGGGVYCNGHQSNVSVIRYNYVDYDDAVFAVYYLDNGASQWNVTHNVAGESPQAWGFFMQGCCNLPALNSSVDNFWYRNTETPNNACAAEGCVVDASTVFQVADGSAWPADAQAIVDGAGNLP